MSEYALDQDDNDHQQSGFLTRQVVSLDNNDSRTKKNSDNQGEAIFLETEPFTNSNQQKILSPEKTSIVDLFSPDELEANTENVHRISKPNTPTRTRRPISKIPIRSNSSFRNHRQTSSTSSNKGAFHFFTPNDERKRLASSDDEDIHLKEDDLKQKLKEEKRHGKKTGELLIKLHENYEELLEKYAQAENTIDQLRFQPKNFGDNTPKTTTSSEHVIHITQESKVNIAALRSSGVYGSPLSSIRPVPSTTTTTTTPVRKSVSPTNSGTIESIFFDEVSSETLKVDLLFETKTLGDKMKSFLTLMDENQLNLAEQKEVYENIKQDYEKLMKECYQYKRDADLDIDLHKELETMKQLLTDIVKKITQNLLGKSSIESSSERQTNDNSHSSQLSVRSSLCNHNDLMDQYQRLLNAVNTPKPGPIKSINNELQSKPKTDLPSRQESIKSKQKAYVYVSGDSDDEQQENDDVTPIPYTKGVESTSFGLDYIPSTSVKHHQHPIEEQRYENLQSKRKQQPHENRYSTTSRTNDYDSGIGTNNLTKLSYDSKLYTSTMDESHFQSLDDEQESISSSSSSRSSGSGSASPGSPYSKNFDKQSNYRRKPSGHSSPYQPDTETHITGSFNLPYKKKTMERSYHIWRPEKPSISHRSHLAPVRRSASIAIPLIEDYKMRSRRPLTNLEISSKLKNNQPSSYKSSIYINHTNNKSQEITDRDLYLDPQTGIVYRYETEKNSHPPEIYYEPSSPSKLYRCMECGSLTNYHHRHHIGSSLKRVITNSDDLGYESGHQRRHRRYRYIDYVSTSTSSSEDSDSDVSPTYLEMIALNQAYNRAEKIRHQSRSLSRYIVRQLKLAIATL